MRLLPTVLLLLLVHLACTRSDHFAVLSQRAVQNPSAASAQCCMRTAPSRPAYLNRNRIIALCRHIRTEAPSKPTIQLSPEQVYHNLKHSLNFVYVDVRTHAEFAAGHVPNAVNVPLTTADMKPLASFVHNFRKRVQSDRRIVVGCKSGKRSSIAIAKLLQTGFKGLMEVEGGFDNWLSKRNLPIHKL